MILMSVICRAERSWQYLSEQQTEQCRRRNTAMLYTIGDRE